MPFESLFVDDFSKGIDLASARNKIERGFSPDAMNFRLSQFGGLEKVPGYSQFHDRNVNLNDIFYYENAAGTIKRLIVAGTTAWYAIDSAGTVTTIRSGMSSYEHSMFFQYEDTLYGINPVNNLASWNGTTLSTHAPGVNTGPPQGVLLGVWGNRMWVSTSTSMRVNFSAAGVLTGTNSWPTTNYVTLGGGAKTTEFIIGGIPTPDGLMVFTYDSIYIIYDQNTGANRLISGDIGCTSRRSLVLIGPYVYGMSSKGIFRASASGVEIVSDKIAPLFTGETPANLNLAAGLRWGDSYLVSMGRNQTYNDLTFEMNTETGAIMPFEYPAMAFARGPLLSGTEGIEQCFFLNGGAGSARDLIMRGFDGGSFNGSSIACRYETPMDPLGDEHLHKRLRRIRIVGQGTFTVEALTDYSSTVQASGTVTPSETGVGEGFLDLSSSGRRHALKISETGTGTGTPRDILGSTPDGVVGDVQVSLIELNFSKTSRTRNAA